MSIRETRAWIVRCDRCNRDAGTVISEYSPPAPAGWEWAQEGPCGLTNYMRRVLLCPKCSVPAGPDGEDRP